MSLHKSVYRYGRPKPSGAMLSGTGTTVTPASSVADATETSKGIVQLAGGLRGTAGEPRLVPWRKGRKRTWSAPHGSVMKGVPDNVWQASSAPSQAAYHDATYGRAHEMATATTNGSYFDWTSNITIRRNNPEWLLFYRFMLGSPITNVRYFFALSYSAFTSATPINTIGLRYSTDVDTAWMWYHQDSGSGATTSSTGVAPAASTVYELIIKGVSDTITGELFNASGTSLATYTYSSNLPSTSTNLLIESLVINIAAGTAKQKRLFLVDFEYV